MALSAAPKTPAERLIELQQDVHHLQVLIDDEVAKRRTAERELSRYREFREASFGGVRMAQYWCDLIVWEAVLNGHTDLKGIIEIGTWEGGFSWWLSSQALVRRIDFHTFDAVRPPHLVPNFTKLDVFAHPEGIQRMIEQIGEPLVLFCDGGNKPRELKTFAPMLKDPGSLIAVHDWGTETQLSDVPERLVMAHREYCEELGSITRFFHAPA